MKRITFTIIALLPVVLLYAQADTSTVLKKTDTIRVGGMIIIKRGGGDEKNWNKITIGRRKQKHSNISTANWIFDIGFANYTDKTDYTAATLQDYLVNKPGSAMLAKNDLKLKNGKSSNVNIWLFMQRINLIKHYVNLKYGLGIELNNYRFKSPVSFNEGGLNPYDHAQTIPHPFVFRDSISFSKNKLAADYVTIPFMLNLRTNPDYYKKGLSISGGISIGYLYNSRNKQISDERGKLKNHGGYDIEKWKFSYVGELGLGPVRLYGSYSPKSIFENGLIMKPYNIGIRLSNW